MSGDADLRLEVWKRILFANPANPDIQAELRCVLKSVPNPCNNVIVKYLGNSADAVLRLDEATWFDLELASTATLGRWVYLLLKMHFENWMVAIGIFGSLAGFQAAGRQMILFNSGELEVVPIGQVLTIVLTLASYCIHLRWLWVGFGCIDRAFVVTLIYFLKLDRLLRH